MHWRSAVVYAAFGAVVLLLLGRWLNLPVAVMIVDGHSMEPTLRPGDVVVAVRCCPSCASPGDIVVWCTPFGSCTVHRLVRIEGGRLVTWGDNRATNPSPDPPVPVDWLRYCVVGRIPREAVLAAVLAAVALYGLRWSRRSRGGGLHRRLRY